MKPYSPHRHIWASGLRGKFPRRAGYLKKWAALAEEVELPLLGFEVLPESLEVDPPQEEETSRMEMGRDLRLALQKMPNQRAAAVVVLHYWGDLTLTEIAKALGVCRMRAFQLENKALNWLRNRDKWSNRLRVHL